MESYNLDELQNIAFGSVLTESTNEELKEVDIPNGLDEESAENNRKDIMAKLAEYDKAQSNLVRLTDEMHELQTRLDEVISAVKLANKDLVDSIEAKASEIQDLQDNQEKVKTELLKLQRAAFNYDEKDKTFIYNKIQSTYVAPTESNKFDLKSFREKESNFWKEHLSVLEPYATIKDVADYIKVTIKK